MRTTNGPTGRRILDVIDAHAGGDVGRVVLDGIGNLPAGTVAERARFLRQHGDAGFAVFSFKSRTAILPNVSTWSCRRPIPTRIPG